MTPKVSLEQWQALVAVVDAGSYAKASEALHKSQSSVTYAVQLLYRRAKVLLEEAGSVEKAAKSLSAGWEAEIRIAAEVLFPTWLLFQSFERFGRESPDTRIELIESVMAGTTEALANGSVDLAIAEHIPPGFEGEAIMRTPMILVAHAAHPLHALGRPVTRRDLRAHRHIV